VSQPPQKDATSRPASGTPRFRAFLLTGGILGLLAGLLLSLFGPADPSYDGSAALGFLGLIGAGLGLLVGGIVAVLVDRRT
jgi:hypothetical protein